MHVIKLIEYYIMTKIYINLWQNGRSKYTMFDITHTLIKIKSTALVLHLQYFS